MAYKSRKRLREKCLFGADGAITAAATLAAAAMNVAATTKAAKEQAKAVKANADAQAKAQTQAAKVQSEALAQQSENNTQNMTEQINAQKELQESQNDIMKEMNLNLALQAGQQNAEERDKASKIVVRCGGSLRGKRLAGGLTLQDNNYVVPVGQGLVLLRGGSPSNPQDQTHANSHKNNITGRHNKGSYLKVGNKEIEAEAGGNRTIGEIVDPSDRFVYSQRRFLPNGTSPVEEILAGVPKEQVKLEQELTKKMLGIKNDGSKAMYGRRYMRCGGHCRRPKAPYGDSPYTIGDYKSDYYNYQFDDDWDNPYNRILKGLNNPQPTTGNANTGKQGSWWSRQDDATKTGLIGAGVNLLGWGIGAIGNNIAKNRLTSANNYANEVLAQARGERRDIVKDAYSRMHGIDSSIIKDDDFKVTHAIANVRAGRYNVNDQLAQVERGSAAQMKSIRGGMNSALARQKLMSDIATRAQDARDKIYATQTNEVEKINQSNIEQLNAVAMKNAELDSKSKANLSALKVDVAKYNNDIENAKIQGMADADVDYIMGNAEGNAQTRMYNSQLSAENWKNGLSGLGNVLANAGQQYYNARQAYNDNQTKYQIAAMSAQNPNIPGIQAANTPEMYSNQTLKQIYSSVTDNNLKNKLRTILAQRGVQVS